MSGRKSGKKSKKKLRNMRSLRRKRLWSALLVIPLIAVMAMLGLVDADASTLELEKEKVADQFTLEHWAYSFGSGTVVAGDELPKSDENLGRIWTDKSVFTNSVSFGDINVAMTDGADFLIGLSALSSASSKTTTSQTPLDIVLALDLSGSMNSPMDDGSYTPVYNVDQNEEYYIYASNSWKAVEYSNGAWRGVNHSNANTATYQPKTSTNDNDESHTQFYSGESRLDALKTAVKDFIGATAEQNDEIGDPDKQHRIAVVKFASNNSGDTGDELYADGNFEYNYTQIVSGLTAYGTANCSTLQYTVDGFIASGTTSADYAMTHVQTVLESARTNAKKVVIFFTDGEPTHYSGFWQDVAASAVNAARSIKNEGAVIYTIGVFDDADPSDTTSNNFNIYMNGISSNYPDASATSTGVSTKDNNASRWVPALGDPAEENDYYKAAESSEELSSIFEEISKSLAEPNSPTLIESGQPASASGYITFTDQLGDYMEVKDFNNIYFDGRLFSKSEEKSTATSYVFEGEAENAIYPEGNLSSIIINVQKSSNEKTGDVVSVKIPASLIPLRYYDIDNDETINGSLGMTITETRPIRVFYSVGLKDSVTAKLASGNITDSVLKKYIEDNTLEGKACFYSNAYVSGSENGVTTAEFTPAASNPFYYYTEDTPLYTDVEFKNRATTITNDGKYYYQNAYYANETVNGETATVRKVSAIEVLGTDILSRDGAYAQDDSGCYMTAGSIKVSRMRAFTEQKGTNATGTASTVIMPSWNANSQHATIFLGNNGRLGVAVPGSLAISKTVTAGEGLTAPAEAEFTFKVNLKNEDGDALEGTYAYEVTDGQGNAVVDSNGEAVTGSVSDGGTLKLKAGQTAIIGYLPENTVYTVEETGLPDGFKMTVPENEGNISGNIEDGVRSYAAFTNRYSVSPVSLEGADNLKVQKVLTGRQWDTDDSFEFVLEAVSYEAPDTAASADEPAVIADVEIPVPAGGNTLSVSDGEVTYFGDIEFSVPGTYTYLIYEKTPDSGAIAGITYSKAVYRVIVTVADQGNGELTVSSVMKQTFLDNGTNLGEENWIDVPGKTAVITNDFSTDEQSGDIFATKVYTDNSGNNPIALGKFRFKLKAVTPDAPMPDNSNVDGEGYVYMTNDASGGIAFEHIMFNSSQHDGQTYEYELSEDIPAGANAGNNYTLNGMTYDPTVYTVKIAVNVNHSTGALEAVTTYYNVDGNAISTERPVFTNSYTPEPAVLEGATALHGAKTLFGRDMLNGESFNFSLTNTGRTDGVTIETGGDTASVSGGKNRTPVSFNFGKVTFSKVGTYIFRIEEESGSAGGVKYDTHICTVTVNVTDNNGVLEAAATYDNETVSQDITQAVFLNTYTTGSVTQDESNRITVRKTLTGRNWTTDDRFYFRLTGVDGTATPADNEINIVLAENGTDQFETITYDHAGTYTYTVEETYGAGTSGIPGVTYDTHVAKVTVYVVDNGDGTLKIDRVVYDNNADGVADADKNVTDTAAFTNTYKAGSTSLAAADMQLNVTKNLVGREWNDGDSFSFELAAIGNAPMPDSSIAVAVKSGQKAVFGDIPYDTAGTYQYTITETAGTEDGMTYDGHSCTATVVVEDNLQGGLVVRSVTYDGSQTFTNVYAGDSKTVTKNSADVNNGSIQVGDILTYQITWYNDAVDANGLLTAATVVVTDKIPDGTVYVEDSADQNGVYDADEKRITWTIGDAAPAASGTVSFQVRVDGSATGGISNQAEVKIGDNDPKYTNEVKSTVGAVDLTISKKVELVAGENTSVDKDREFSFEVGLKDESGASLAGSYACTVDGSERGSVSDGGTIVLKDGQSAVIAGIPEGSRYTVTEKDIPEGYTADANSKSGTIAATGDNTAAFVNTYSIAGHPAAVTVSASKKLTYFGSGDSEKKLAEGQFSFKLSGEGIERSATNDADGNIRFENIVLSSAGEYIFTMEEIKGNLGGIEYDDRTFTVKVTVTDDGKGELQADTRYYLDGSELSGAPEFVNNYTADFDGVDNITLKAKKELTGRSLTAGEFSFSVTDEDGKVVSTGTNDADGNINFSSFGFDITNEEYQELVSLSEGAEEIESEEAEEEEKTDVETETEEAAEAETEEETETEMEETADADTKADESEDAETSGSKDADVGANGSEGINTGTEEDADANAKAEEDVDVKAEENAEANANADSNSEETADAETVENADADTEMKGDVEAEETEEATEPLTMAVRTFFTSESVIEDDNVKTDEETDPSADDTSDKTVEPSGDDALDKTVEPSGDDISDKTADSLEDDTSREEIETSKGNISDEGINPASDDPADSNEMERQTLDATVSKEAQARLKELLGDHWYKITEDDKNQGGITYDNNIYYVKVTVSDDGDGRLSVSEPIYYETDRNTELKGITFKNSYKAGGTEITLNASKLLFNRELKADEFTFRLTENGEIVGEVKNETDGSIGFDLAFESEGVHTYIMSEVKGADEQITYDEKTYEVTVIVTDDGNGELHAAVEYPEEAVVFTNTYNAPDPGPEPEPENPDPDPDPEPENPDSTPDPEKSGPVYESEDTNAESTPVSVVPDAKATTEEFPVFIPEQGDMGEAEVMTSSPQTGDDRPIELLSVMLAVSAAALIGVVTVHNARPKKRAGKRRTGKRN